VAFTASVIFAVLVMSTVRQLLLVHEVRRLYLEVATAAEGRRVLVAELLRSVDVERHRVATQLHEQAVSSYTAFASVSSDGAGRDHAPVAAASRLLSERLRTQAEAMRQLMLAVRPLESSLFAQRSIEAPIIAYVDSLYGDGPAPSIDVHVTDDLYWGWATETVLLRIAQEAVRNVWRHSRATHVRIGLDAPGDTLELRISDDGVGFDPAAVTESGIATMRLFASFCDGTIDVDSQPGTGTTIRARVGAAVVTPPPAGMRRLRLVPDHADDLDVVEPSDPY
jgi:signal transduction histidine kinase